jgi:hypothetical protein
MWAFGVWVEVSGSGADVVHGMGEEAIERVIRHEHGLVARAGDNAGGPEGGEPAARDRGGGNDGEPPEIESGIRKVAQPRGEERVIVLAGAIGFPQMPVQAGIGGQQKTPALLRRKNLRIICKRDQG